MKSYRKLRSKKNKTKRNKKGKVRGGAGIYDCLHCEAKQTMVCTDLSKKNERCICSECGLDYIRSK